MSIPSWEMAKLLDICFSGVLWASLEAAGMMGQQPFPDVDKYVRGEKGSWTFDFKAMMKEKPFADLFPPDAKNMTRDAWRAFTEALFRDKKPGGIAGPFIERDDDAFIRGFNAAARPKLPFARSGVFSVPVMFFTCMDDLTSYAVYEPDKNEFEWDFSAMISFNPKSEYEAFKRYAHARYSTLAIGQAAMPSETRPQKVYETGSAAILNAFTKTPDWELVEDALQAFPGKDPYTLSTLEDVVTDTRGQMARNKKIERKDGEQPVFDHKDMVNIVNAVHGIRPFLSDEDQVELGEAGLAVRVRLLYKAVMDPAIREQIDPRRIKTVETLHNKLDSNNSLSLDASLQGEDTGETEKTIGDTQRSSAATPEQDFEDREARKTILRLFEERFTESKEFLHCIREFLLHESSTLIGHEIGRYAGKRGHNAGGKLFKMFREAGGIVVNAKDSKVHTLFTEKIRWIIDNLRKEEER